MAARTVELKDPDIRQPSWSRYYQAPSYHAGDVALAYPLQVLAEVVGGGATSRLYKGLVVDQKLAESADAGYDPSAVGLGIFAIDASPRPGVSIEDVQKSVLALLHDVAEKGVTAQEVDRAKDRLRAGVAYATDSPHTVARVLGQALATGQSVDEVEHWPDHIAAVTLEQVNQAARDVLKDEASVTGLLLPANPGEAGDDSEVSSKPSPASLGREFR